jgi:hypothetical protein
MAKIVKLATPDDASSPDYENRRTVFVDMTPSWSGIVGLYIMALEDGSPSAKQAAREELTRMARLADLYNDHAKAVAALRPGGAKS